MRLVRVFFWQLENLCRTQHVFGYLLLTCGSAGLVLHMIQYYTKFPGGRSAACFSVNYYIDQLWQLFNFSLWSTSILSSCQSTLYQPDIWNFSLVCTIIEGSKIICFLLYEVKGHPCVCVCVCGKNITLRDFSEWVILSLQWLRCHHTSMYTADFTQLPLQHDPLVMKLLAKLASHVYDCTLWKLCHFYELWFWHFINKRVKPLL